MSEMVELVARSICESERMNPDDPLGGWRHWELAARAAIGAMRTPTKKMVDAACKSMSPEHRPTPERVSVSRKHRIRYQAMIDEALRVEDPK